MDIAYENFSKIAALKGVTPYRIAKDTGLTTVLFTDWKKGKSKPKIDKLTIIANYLGISVDSLLSDTANPVTEISVRSNIDERLLNAFHSLNTEGKELVIDYVEGLAEKPKYSNEAPIVRASRSKKIKSVKVRVPASSTASGDLKRAIAKAQVILNEDK